MTELLDIMRSQENYFSNSYTYTSDLAQLVGLTTVYITSNNRYSITADKCGVLDLTECVELTAEPINGQQGDGDLTLNSRGVKTHKGDPGWIK
jgi:type IV pilus assembly protein PilE